MARRGCVFVSVNYRLGALGCVDFSALSTPTTKIEGNLFLRDLVMALGWVRDNIAVFGGDPDTVTIFEHDSGVLAGADERRFASFTRRDHAAVHGLAVRRQTCVSRCGDDVFARLQDPYNHVVGGENSRAR